jgi:hypothetical protein
MFGKREHYGTDDHVTINRVYPTNLLFTRALPKYGSQGFLKGESSMSVRSCRTSPLVVGVVLVLCACPAIASSKTYPEHEVKAAFLYNFMKFTDWPEEKVADANETVTIFVVGDYPECKTFRDIQEKSSENNPVQVQIFKSYEQVKDPNILKSCYVLFICKSEKKHLAEILSLVKDSPVLTVGEEEGFLEKGGIINFVEYREKLRFEVNIPAASEAGLKLRSKLLKLAKHVITDDTGS